MIHHVVQFALRQRFLILMLALLVLVTGTFSFRQMPVDAYPDLSPPLVEVITQWPGHAAEEIERLVTLPIELQMNGVPHMITMRSISLYGLSDLRLTFEENTDDYLARQIVFERLAQAPIKLFITATNVRTGRGKVFRNNAITPEVLRASTCLPTMFQAIEIDGDPYPGALLLQSEPGNDLATWWARSKDHVYSTPHSLRACAPLMAVRMP